jgi:hypothetical protein
MSKHDVSPHEPIWQELAAALSAMSAMLAQPSMNLVQLAERFETAANALLAGAQQSGLSSLRLRAVVKALDLKTPKSTLERFLE